MGTDCGFLLPVQKRGNRGSCGSHVLRLTAPPSPCLAQPPPSPPFCASYTDLSSGHAPSCFPALAHAGHSARNTLLLAVSFHFLPTATLAPYLISGLSFRSHLEKTLPECPAQASFPRYLVSLHFLLLHGIWTTVMK